MNVKVVVAILVAQIMLVSASAVSENSKPALKVLLGTSGRSPYSETASGDILSAMNAAVLGQLLRTDENFDLKPGLLEKWSFDFKTRRYSLTLRKGIQFSNGREAKSADLEFSLLRGFYTNAHSFYSIFLGNVLGIENAKVGKFSSGKVAGVRVVTPYTVEVELKQPNPSFLHALVLPYFSLVPIEELKSDYVNWKRFPVGAGPYRVVSGFDGKKVVLTKTAAALSTAPERVALYTSAEGESFDVVCDERRGIDAPELKAERTKLPTDVVTLFFTNRNPLGTSPSFRLAVAHAIDRKAIAQGLEAYGSPTYEMLPTHFWGRADIPDPYHPAKARALLAEVPSLLLKKTWPVPVLAGKEFSKEYAIIFSRIEKQLSDVGINVKFHPSQEKFISEQTAIQSPLSVSGRVSDYVDPLVMFASFRKNSAYVYERPLDDPQFEELYQKASGSLEKENRIETVRSLSKYLNDKAIAIPFLERYITRFFNPARVESLGDQSQPLTLFIDRILVKNAVRAEP